MGGARELPERPDVDNPRIKEQRTRHIRRQQEDADADSNGRVAREQYKALVERVRLIVTSAVPPDATVVVVSKGDEQLLDLECGEAWHLPASPDGSYIGYHPPDATGRSSSWSARGPGALTISCFPRLRSGGSSITRLAQHVSERYPQIVEDDSCAIYALGRFPALYGREREDTVRSHQRVVSHLVREATGPIPSAGLHEE